MSKKRPRLYRPGPALHGLAEVPAPRPRLLRRGRLAARRRTAPRASGAVLVGEPTARRAGLPRPGRQRHRGQGGPAARSRCSRPLTRRRSRPSPTRCRSVDATGTAWVRPEVVVEIAALGMTPARRLRQPAYRGRARGPVARDLTGGARWLSRREEVLVEVDGRTLRISNLRQGDVPGSGHHQGRGAALLRAGRPGAAAAPGRPGGDPDPLAARHRRHAVLREEPAVRAPRLAALGDRAVDRLARGAATASSSPSSRGWPT